MSFYGSLDAHSHRWRLVECGSAIQIRAEVFALVYIGVTPTGIPQPLSRVGVYGGSLFLVPVPLTRGSICVYPYALPLPLPLPNARLIFLSSSMAVIRLQVSAVVQTLFLSVLIMPY